MELILLYQFSIRFPFSNCNMLWACPIDSGTPRYQPTALRNEQFHKISTLPPQKVMEFPQEWGVLYGQKI